MIDLYGKAHCHVHFGKAGEPMQTLRAALKTNPRGDNGDSMWRVNVPGYGWRKLRYEMYGAPYVVLTHGERATVSA